MRKHLMDGLRKAGEKLKEFDTNYAHALVPNEPTSIVGSLGAYGRGTPLHEIRNSFARIDEDGVIRDPLPSERRFFPDALWESALYSSNIASRYALPAGGITLAGKGLYDLSQGLYAIAAETPVFGGPEDGAQPGQLPLY